MTPKEKAEELVNKFGPLVMWKMGQEDVKRRAKECALIAVDEILNQLNINIDGWDIKYWIKVKQEIEKL